MKKKIVLNKILIKDKDFCIGFDDIERDIKCCPFLRQNKINLRPPGGSTPATQEIFTCGTSGS